MDLIVSVPVFTYFLFIYGVIFLTASSFGASGRLCFVIVLYLDIFTYILMQLTVLCGGH